MKKKFILVPVILLLAGLFTVACNNNGSELEKNEKWGMPLGRFAGLDAKTENQLLEDMLEDANNFFNSDHSWDNRKMTSKDLWVERYCGTYNGYITVILGYNEGGPGKQITYRVSDEEKDHYVFRLSSRMYMQVIVWKDGEFMRINQAYDSGLLEWEDIEKIREIMYEPLP